MSGFASEQGDVRHPLPEGEGGAAKPGRVRGRIIGREGAGQPPGGIPLTRSPAATTLSLRERLSALAFLFAFVPLAAHAVTPGEKLPDPAMEARARAITSELRCLVCQNQSVDDSDAALAKDLRVLVRDKLKEGLSDVEVKDYVHSRYGDFVLLRPPVKMGTILLWTAPLIALLAGGLAVWSAARRRVAPAAPAGLTAEEREKLRVLGLHEGD